MITDGLDFGTMNVGYVTVDGATNNTSYLCKRLHRLSADCQPWLDWQRRGSRYW
jgi:hypothetical protein